MEGKKALVTGAGRRLGRDIALALAREGVDLGIHFHRSTREAAALVDEIRDLGRRAFGVRADLSVPDAAGELIGRAVADLGGIDILINNASVFPESRLEDVTAQMIQENVQINAVAPLLVARAFAGQERPGVIVNLLDTRMVDYDAKHVAYHLSKRMLYSVTRMMAIEYAPRIRVGGVAPGLILPPPGEDESYLERLAHTNPLQAHGSADDVSAAVLFLVRSPFVTGQVIFVDGGRHLRGRVYD